MPKCSKYPIKLLPIQGKWYRERKKNWGKKNKNYSTPLVDGYPETPLEICGSSDACHRSRLYCTCWQGCGWTGRYRRASILPLHAACAINIYNLHILTQHAQHAHLAYYMDYCRELFVMKLDLPIAGAFLLSWFHILYDVPAVSTNSWCWFPAVLWSTLSGMWQDMTFAFV